MAEFDSVIPAGGSGTLTARVNTTIVQSGRMSKSVSVSTDAPGGELMRLIVNFHAVAPITATPRLRLNLNAAAGETATARILLHRPGGEPLEIVVPSQDVPVEMEFRTEKVKEAESLGRGMRAVPGDVWLEATMSPQSKTIRWTGRLTMETNVPDAPQLQFPVSIWVKPRIDVRPQRVRLLVPNDPKAQPSSVTVRLTHGAQEPFGISGIEVSHPEVFTAAALTESNRRYHTIRVSLADEFDPANFKNAVNGTVSIRSSDQIEKTIEIPVSVSRHPISRRRAASRTPTPGTG